MNKILQKIKGKIKSTDEKVLLKEFDKIKKQIEDSSKKLKINCKVFLGGSLAKKTILKNNQELDIFVRFNKEYKNGELSQLLQNIIDKIKYKYTKIHGSRDYFKMKVKNYEVELIPIFEIETPNDAENITDISPLHVAWVKKKINFCLF